MIHDRCGMIILLPLATAMICKCFLPFTRSKKKPCPDSESDNEIQIHGTAAKEPKAAEEDCLTHLSNLVLSPSEIDVMKEAKEKQKAVEYSVNQFDEESSEEESSEEESEEEESEEEVYGVCRVCFKDKEHSTFECPYLDCIPDPKNTTISMDYFVVCKECGRLGGHPERDWEGRAMAKPIEFMTDYKPDGYEELMKLHPVKYVTFF